MRANTDKTTGNSQTVDPARTLVPPESIRPVAEADLYPAFLKLGGRRCLVVGGGPVALQKAVELLRCGARVKAVSIDWSAGFAELDGNPALERETRPFAPADLDGVFLVIAATSDAGLQHEIAAAAERRAILCNVADVPELCNFYVPASLRRGSLTVSVSTNGGSPLLAVALRNRLAAQLGPHLGPVLERFKEAREIVRGKHPSDQGMRRRELESLIAPPVLDQLFEGSLDAFEARWRSWKSSLSA